MSRRSSGCAGLTQQINAEERGNGVRACSICPRDVNTPLLDKRPQPPAAGGRATMLQPDDLAACVWLVATLPSRAIVDEISLSDPLVHYFDVGTGLAQARPGGVLKTPPYAERETMAVDEYYFISA